MLIKYQIYIPWQVIPTKQIDKQVAKNSKNFWLRFVSN